MRSTVEFVANEFSDAAEALQVLRSEAGAHSPLLWHAYVESHRQRVDTPMSWQGLVHLVGKEIYIGRI